MITSHVPSIEKRNLLLQAAKIVSAYVSNNAISATDLPDLIAITYEAFKAAASVPSAVEIEALRPAVPINKSITPDYIICLDDGKQFKSLKRHLSVLGMTPEQYRAKWGLPPNYPMVARTYAARRAELAKINGLGRTAAPTSLVDG